MVVYRLLSLLGIMLFLGMQLLPVIMAACPLDLSGSNFTLAASLCSKKDERGKCCRYVNALIAVSIARYANTTSHLGVSSNLSDICLHSISQTLELYGVPQNATIFCGFGTKIPVNYECKGRTTVTQMLQSPKFVDVTKNCRVPLSEESNCRKCLNAGIIYLHHLVGTEDNMTLSTCRDATFAALASQVEATSAVDIASCFFGVQGLTIPLASPSLITPEASPSPFIAASPSHNLSAVPLNHTHHSYHLTLIPGVGIAVTVVAVIMLLVLVVLIRRKSRELEDCENIDKTSSKTFPPPRGSSMFQKFSYKEIKKATDNFNTIVGRGDLELCTKPMPNRTPLSWRRRIQIAIDVANALEYLHFYCDPPLCHRDIKSSNILLDENFVAKVADFGLAHASKDGSICFEPVNTDVRGTPGYMDPEYVITQELTEKSDVYSYGVLLLEIVTSRRAIQDGKNLVEWSQAYMASESRLSELVDPSIRNSCDMEQLQTIVSIVRWCTQKEGRSRPSIKQVLRILYESSDPMHSGFVEAVEDEEYEGIEGRPRTSKGKMHRNETLFHSGDGRYFASSSSTSRSYCSRSFLLETGSSPHSPPNVLSV
ncbi:hypothetical protein FNV43_RR22506 [Rhamnella rubrinervis]|uniref:Protein kinase domain-containing protein n=1 Tax=Rhamnella rubrinervis TaxID=2594499 RepID=A0A8K0GN88_9ROSA|nr:hypothetical protein FNV43_RR22506 [Rhamnella rubrinervis]